MVHAQAQKDGTRAEGRQTSGETWHNPVVEDNFTGGLGVDNRMAEMR
jgi:hypothetical protein